MKKKFSVEQIVGVLKQAEVGVPGGAQGPAGYHTGLHRKAEVVQYAVASAR